MLLEYGNLFFIYLIGLISVLLFSFATYLLSNKYSIILNKNHTTLILIFSFFFYFISALNLSIAVDAGPILCMPCITARRGKFCINPASLTNASLPGR